MVLQRRQRLPRPVLELGIFTTVRVALAMGDEAMLRNISLAGHLPFVRKRERPLKGADP